MVEWITKPDLKKVNGRIQYYQQKLARQKKGGSNWNKTLHKLHKWINKKNNKINDYYHKISYNIVKHFKFIAMEKLMIRGMIKGNLSRSIHEIGWGKLTEMIKYKQTGTDVHLSRLVLGFHQVRNVCFVVMLMLIWVVEKESGFAHIAADSFKET